MRREFPSVIEFGLESAADILTRGFADYLVKIAASPAMLLGMVRADSVDLAASRIVLQDGRPAGAALLARRGWTCRLAGMCVLPAERRTGAGRALLDRLCADAVERGERTMVLEVIEQNPAAVHLYERAGFGRIRRLVGFTGTAAPAGAGGDPAPLTEVDIRALASAVAQHGLPDLPWQLSAETLAQSGPPAQAFRCGGSWVLVADPSAATLAVRALLTEPAARGQGSATLALRAIMARWPGKPWRVPALMPEEFAPAFTGAGLARADLSQWQMTRPLG